MRKVFLIITLVLLITVFLIWKFIIKGDNTCTIATGWGAGVQQRCTCEGQEKVVIDTLAADGIRQTICLGKITSKTCFVYNRGKGGTSSVPCKQY